MSSFRLRVVLGLVAVAIGALAPPASSAGSRTRAVPASAPPTATGPSVVVGSSLDGAVRGNSGPPDPQFAVSPKYVVELVNSQLNIWRRGAGFALVDQVYSCQWFGIPDYCSDPRVTYDPVSHRFFASSMSDSAIVVAVSATPDPTGAWYRQQIPAEVDMPRLAVTADKVIIGDNGDDIWVLQKSDLLAATAEPVHARLVHRHNGNAVVGPITLEVGAPDAPTGYAIARGGTDTTAAKITEITGTPARHDVALHSTVLHVPYRWRDPVLAPQKGGPYQTSDDFYPKQGMVVAGNLWYPVTEPCTPAGDTKIRDCVHLVQVDVSTARPTLVQEVEIGVPGRYLIDPAVGADPRGRAVVVATEGGRHTYYSIVAIPVSADGRVGRPAVLRAGRSYAGFDNFNQNGVIRWGDYSSAAVDPVNPDTLWLGGEYSRDTADWGTSLSAVTVTDPECGSTRDCQPGTFRPVRASRVLDTRAGRGTPAGPVAAHATVRIRVAGRAGVPAGGVSAVAVTMTAVGDRSGHLTAYPDGPPAPAAQNLAYAPRQPRSATMIVPVGAGGRIAVHNASAGQVQLTADVTGYYLAGRPSTSGAYRPALSGRVLHTTVGAGSTRGAQIVGAAGVPGNGVAAVALTLTATSGRAGRLTTYPAGTRQPATGAGFAYRPGQTTDLVTVPVGAHGRIDLHNTSAGGVTVTGHVTGYFLAGRSNATGARHILTPRRTAATTVAAGRTIVIPAIGHGGVPTRGVAAVSVTFTATSARAGSLIAYADRTSRPHAVTLTYQPGNTATTTATIPVGADGRVAVHNTSGGSIRLTTVVTGYYSG